MLTQRLGSSTQKDEKFINDLIKIIHENPKSCDEVWLASEYGFPKMDTHISTAKLLAVTAEKFRSEGIRVSLQISNTIGHGQYMSSRDCSGLVGIDSKAEKMVGVGGEIADYCFCWNGENFRKYVITEIREYAEKIQPHTVWIDDDLRASNHNPVNFGCFCDNCIKKFNNKYGSDFNREQLVYEINRGDISWRVKYVEFLRENLAEFTFLMSKAVHDVSPDSFMGYQYCAHGAYTGFDFSYIFGAMKKATGKNPKCRPGGGAYNDYNPNEILNKAIFIDWQNAMLPDYVTEIRPEIENLPDVAYGKTIAGTCFETSLYLAGGANAMSYAMLMNDYEPMQWHGKMLGAFSAHRRYWEQLAAANSGTIQSGLNIFYSKEMYKRTLGESESNFSWNSEPYSAGTDIRRTAIPLAYLPTGKTSNPIYLLRSSTAVNLSDEDISELLTHPVVTDGDCLKILSDRGYSFGARAVYTNTAQLYERYSTHKINGAAAGRRWAQSFYYPSGYRIEDIDGTTEPFGYYETDSKNLMPLYDNAEHPYGIANAVVTTEKGAKWAVFGHYLWNPTQSTEKRNQIISAADYISDSRINAILETPWQAILLPRENAEAMTTSVSIVNCTIGTTDELQLRIRRPAGGKFEYANGDGTFCEISPKYDKDEVILNLPPFSPWTVATVFVKK